MNPLSGRDACARRTLDLTTSVEALETRNLLSAGGTIVPPTLTPLEKILVHELDAYVNSHPGSLTEVEQTRQTLLAAIGNRATPSLIRELEQAALDVVDQVLIDHGEGQGGGQAQA